MLSSVEATFAGGLLPLFSQYRTDRGWHPAARARSACVSPASIRAARIWRPETMLLITRLCIRIPERPPLATLPRPIRLSHAGPTASYSGRPDAATALVRFRRTGVTEYLDGPDHSGLMWAARITFPHFSVSSVMSVLKSADEPPRIIPPRSTSCVFSLGSARPALISLLSLSTISAGVFAGAPKPK